MTYRKTENDRNPRQIKASGESVQTPPQEWGNIPKEMAKCRMEMKNATVAVSDDGV